MPNWNDKQACSFVAANLSAEFETHPGHNDKGYGTIDDEGGREVYFLHDAVPGIHGFDDLRRGQTVEYTLEDGPYLRANFVSETTAVPANGQRPTVYMPGEGR